MYNRVASTLGAHHAVHNSRVENQHYLSIGDPVRPARMSMRIRRQPGALDRMRVDKMYARALRKGGRL